MSTGRSLSSSLLGQRVLMRVRRRWGYAEKSDPYDVLAYIAFALAPITREERVTAQPCQASSQGV